MYKFLSIFVLSFFFSTSVLFAAGEVKPESIPCVPNLPCIQEKTQEGGGAAVRKHIIDVFGVKFFTTFLAFIAATSVIFIIVGGLQMHLAFGNEEAITKAKKTLIWAIAGLVISILSVAVVQIISKLDFK